ncbi:PP2C family protein-serine/threonine phosphatase [Streptomyces sp. NBC_00358]|uniref:PP2C family protein-serine/threonine phosphatase n=1 Tax=Streptomyces sp. NBC_00358 TaxID=2975725 RepID=UPI002E25CBD2
MRAHRPRTGMEPGGCCAGGATAGRGGEDTAGEAVPSDALGDAIEAIGTSGTHCAARLAAVHLGHSRRHDSVRGTVLDLQRALLAEPGRPHPNPVLATRHLPAGGGALVGGDWFGTVRVHFGRTLLVGGDVMGHGPDAAVGLNAYRSMPRSVASTGLPPHRVLRRPDAAVAEDGTRCPATCLLVRVDPARGTAAIAGAGHLPPVLFAGDGSGELLPCRSVRPWARGWATIGR